MFLLPTWWIQLWEHLAFILSLSIITVKILLWKLLWLRLETLKRLCWQNGYIEWYNYYTAVTWRWRSSYTNSCKSTKQTVAILMICCGRSWTDIIFTWSKWTAVSTVCLSALSQGYGTLGCIRKVFLGNIKHFSSLTISASCQGNFPGCVVFGTDMHLIVLSFWECLSKP